MTHIRTTLAALAFGLIAIPVTADAMSFDLPRLNFPAPGTETSRDCTMVAVPGGPNSCTPTAN
ncbi:hypothetical protein [Defluviimonas sp. SAOS-178_SWC]|uniref:hypothetical protein n=1 Tax=Defluviimonas sp. SAOS-178_SWC TaxID=3121287 RepID=UPI0032215D5E